MPRKKDQEEPLRREANFIGEPLIVRGQGTRFGYLRPPKAFARFISKLNPKLDSKNFPEPTPFLVHKEGVVELIFRWKEEELCPQPNRKQNQQKRRKQTKTN